MVDERKPLAPWIVLAGAAVGVVGCFLPWVKAVAPFLGTVTWSGVDGARDGWLVLAALLVAGGAAAAALLRGPSRVAGVVAALVALVALVISVIDLGRILVGVDDVVDTEMSVAVNVGPGIVVAVLGSLVATMGGVLMILMAKKREPATP